MSDSEEECFKEDENMEVRKEPPPGVTGLALAEHYFGPLLSPTAATPAQWTAYTEHRRGVNAKYRNVFDRQRASISDGVAAIEKELGLDNGALQKCISVMMRMVMRDSVDVSGVRPLSCCPIHGHHSQPRDADILVRIYSPAVPKYIDVHIKYHCRSRLYNIEWFYSIGYRICNRISGEPTAYFTPPTDSPPSVYHARGGWQPICWGFYDDEDNYGSKWRRIEVADMGLYDEGVLDVHETLFGSIEMPSGDNADAILAYRRKLVATVRLLLATVGIDYEVACTDGERDEGPRDYMLEGLSDKWVARGIRDACGFQLSGDEGAAKHGEEERKESAGRADYYVERDSDDEDEDEDEWL